MIVYNSGVTSNSSANGHEKNDLHHKQNNNAPLGATTEVLDNRGSHSKQDMGKVDNRDVHVQGDINENSKGSKPLARVIPNQVQKPQECNAKQGNAARAEKDNIRMDTEKKKQHTAGTSSQGGQKSNQPVASNMNVNSVNLITPTPDSRGDITPPIVVEMWEETDTTGKTPKQTGNTLNSHQSPSGPSTKKLSTQGHSREEREPTPTPFFRDQTKQRQRHQQQQQQQHTTGHRGPALSVPGKSSLKEGPDFQREPTPFYDHKKDTNINASHGNSLGVPGAAGQNVRPPRESTPFLKDEKSTPPHQTDGGSTLAPPSSSLAVPTSGVVRDVRESTPYYDEKDPYEYIHHPDHHFSEKKSVIVKQSSTEDDHTTSETKRVAPTAKAPSSSSPPVPAKRPTSRPPEPPNKPPQNLPLKIPTPHPAPGRAVSPTLNSPSENEPFADSYQRRLRNCRQTPPPESREIMGKTSKVATLQSPGKASQSVIRLIPGESLTMDKNTPTSPSSSKDTCTPSTNKNQNEALQAKSQLVYKINTPDTSSAKQSTIVQNKKVEISKTTNTTKESSKTMSVTVNKKTIQDKSVLSSSSLQTKLQSVAKEESSLSTLMSKSSLQSLTKSSMEQTKTTTDTQKQSLLMSKTQTKIPVQPVAQANTQIKIVSENSSAKLQTSSSSTSKLTTVTTTSHTTGIPLPRNSKGLTTQKTAPLAAHKSIVVQVSTPTNAASPTATSQSQISEQLSSQAASSSASARPRTRRTRSCTRSPEISKNATMAIGTSEDEQGAAFADDTPLLGPDSKPKRSLFSNIMSSRQDSRMASTPPADTAWKKKEGKASGFSGALSSFLRPRRLKDNDKDETSVKEKNKRGKSNPDGGKETPKNDQPEGVARRARRLTQTINVQDLAKYSPFGSYTTEGFCLLFIMAVVCLYLNMPIEKFVCYVLAAFYTFCVLRILGLVE